MIHHEITIAVARERFQGARTQPRPRTYSVTEG